MSSDQPAEYPELDPWHPLVTSFDRAKTVVAAHLAEMFLDGTTEEVRAFARGIAAELRREGVDIDDLIVGHLRDLALGPRSADNLPF